MHRGTLPEQRSATGTLATIAQIAHEQQIKAPTIAIFGPVAALGEKLAWLQHRPLHGATVAVTRAREQASAGPAPAWARGRGRGGAGDPHPATLPRSGAGASRLRPDLLHQPQRRAGAVCAARVRGARRARLPRQRECARGGDRPRHGAGAPGQRDPRRRDAGAGRRRGRSHRPWPGSKSRARWWPAHARRATWCPTRCAHAGSRWMCCRSTRTVVERPRCRAVGGGRRRRLPDLHLCLHGAQLPGVGRWRTGLDRAGRGAPAHGQHRPGYQ